MKYIILLLALTASAFGQPIKSPGVNGENIVNPAFRNAVLPSQSTHSDATFTEWGCVETSPMEWLPRTAGIIQHANGSWYRQTLAADGTAEYELLPNQ
jgi:hypothetical protein